jgi:Flp pilus assembly protein TadG
MANVRNRQHQRRGAALLETVLVLLTLLLLTFGMIEYGWLFQKWGHVTNAARQGARVAARPSATVGTVNAAVTAAMNLGNIPGTSYDVNITSNGVAVTDLSTITPGEPIEVEVIVEYDDETDGIALHAMPVELLPIPAQIKAKMVMVKEGP